MSIFNFPNQRIPESQKDKEFHMEHIRNYLLYTGTNEYSEKKREIAGLYKAYSAILSQEDEDVICKTVTERYGANFGPKYTVYPLIETFVEDLISQYRRRPLKRRALVNNENAVIKKLDKKSEMVAEKIVRELNKKIEEQTGHQVESEKPELQIPDDIEEFFAKDYRTISEEIAEDILYQMLIVNQEKEKIYDMLRHYLICERAFGFMDEKDGHPSIYVPHILDCFYDINPNESIQDDMNLFVFDKYMTINEILNNFDLTDKEIEQIEHYANINNRTDDDVAVNNSREIGWFETDGNMIRPRVVSMVWKSLRRVKYKIIENKQTGKKEYKLLPDDYKSRKRDKIKHVDIDDVRHITMLGPEIVLEYGSLENQFKSVGNEKKRFLPVVGVIGKNNVGTHEIRSLAKKLKDLQDFASEVLYELKLSLRQNDGNVMVYDLANIPKEFMQFGPTKALEKVNFHLKRDKIQFINSRDKRANPYASSVNVSQKGRINEVMGLFNVIEDLAAKITGLPPQGRGQMAGYEKATVAEAAMLQTATRTEEYFGIFDSFVEKLLLRSVINAKHIYKENQVFSYYGGDNQTKFLKVFPDFWLDDIGIHIGDNRKEFEKSQKISQMAEAAFNQPQTPKMMLELIRLFNADGSTEKEAILERGLKALEEMRLQNMEAQSKQAQADAEAKAADDERKDNLTREGYQKDIEVAHIYANNKSRETDIKENGQNLRKLAEIDKDLITEQIRNIKNNKEEKE